MAINGIILAAGTQSRFNDDQPKALVKVYESLSALELNMHVMDGFVDKIFVIVPYKDLDIYYSELEFTDVISPIHIIGITPGGGSLRSLKRFFNAIEFTTDDTFILKWGDSIHIDHRIYELFQLNFHKLTESIAALIPIKSEKNPYTDFKIQNNIVQHILFKNKGHQIGQRGNHDQSIFGFGYFLYTYIRDYNRFVTKDSNFLNLFGTFRLQAEVLFAPDDYTTYHYNTIKEYENMVNSEQFNKEIDEWELE